MEQAPRITTVYEKERELRRREQQRSLAQKQRVEARKKAITAFTIIRMLLHIAATPKRELQRRMIHRDLRVMNAARKVAMGGNRDRVLTIGRFMASR